MAHQHQKGHTVPKQVIMIATLNFMSVAFEATIKFRLINYTCHKLQNLNVYQEDPHVYQEDQS